MTRIFIRSPGFSTANETAAWARQHNVTAFSADPRTPDGSVRGIGEVETSEKTTATNERTA